MRWKSDCFGNGCSSSESIETTNYVCCSTFTLFIAFKIILDNPAWGDKYKRNMMLPSRLLSKAVPVKALYYSTQFSYAAYKAKSRNSSNTFLFILLNNYFF